MLLICLYAEMLNGSILEDKMRERITGKTVAVCVLAVFGICFFKTQRDLWICLMSCALPVIYAWSKEHFPPVTGKRMRNYCIVLAALFACACVLGFTISQGGSFATLFLNTESIVKSCFGLVGFFITAFYGLRILFAILDQGRGLTRKRDGDSDKRIARWIYVRPWTFSFIALFLAYLPYIIVSYPAIFMGDVPQMVRQGFGVSELTTHHPLAYVWLLTFTLKAGMTLFHSWNAAVFLFSLAQLAFALFALSLGIKLLIEEAGIHWRWCVGLLVFYSICPRIVNYMFLISKDVYYAAFLILMGQALFCIQKNGWNRKNGLVLAAAALGVLFFRNDGIYVVGITLLILAIVDRGLRRQYTATLLGALVISVTMTHVVVPALGIKAGSKREMLSIPVQQTARYVYTYGDEITAEEEAVILRVFYFDNLKEMGDNYLPWLSDPIKFSFAEQLSLDEAKAYFKTWLSMGMKRPYTYMAAWVANYYEYLYPERLFDSYSYSWSEKCMDVTNKQVGANFYHPQRLEHVRTLYEATRDTVMNTPPFSLINTAGVVTWILLIWAVWLLYSKRYKALSLLLPPFVVMLICLASPCNGYYCRYQYPLLLYLPWVILASCEKEKQNGQSSRVGAVL